MKSLLDMPYAISEQSCSGIGLIRSWHVTKCHHVKLKDIWWFLVISLDDQKMSSNLKLRYLPWSHFSCHSLCITNNIMNCHDMSPTISERLSTLFVSVNHTNMSSLQEWPILVAVSQKSFMGKYNDLFQDNIQKTWNYPETYFLQNSGRFRKKFAWHKRPQDPKSRS